jgi:hypothetical protein
LDGEDLVASDLSLFAVAVFGDDKTSSVVFEYMSFAFIDELEVDRLCLVSLLNKDIIDSELYVLWDSCTFHLDIISVDKI